MTLAAKNSLAEQDYEPTYGARPLKRVIQKLVRDPLAEAILAGRIANGETVKADARGIPKPHEIKTVH